MTLLTEASAALTDGASIATMVTTGLAVITAVAAWIKAAASIKEANAAKIAAANAEARAEEAIRIAAQATDALAGLHTTSAEQLEDERAARDAPAILEQWIQAALAGGRRRGYSSGDRVLSFTLVAITSRAEIFAAKRAKLDPRVAACDSHKEIGTPVTLLVHNPHMHPDLYKGHEP